MIYKQLIACTENKKIVGSISAASSNGTAYFKIIGRIWSWSADEGGILRRSVDEAIKAGNSKAVIIGSSEGGSVFAANDMLSLFEQFEDVKVQVQALMASAFTRLTSRFHTTIKPYTQGMIHMPILSARGNVNQIESTLKLGKNTTEDYANAYAKKTGKTVKEIKALWKDGDYWMNAQELLDEGFVDAIEEDAEAVITDQDVMSLTACGAPIIPEVTATTENNKHKYKMDRDELIAFLGLEADATDDQIKEAKSKMKIDALKHRESANGSKKDPENPNANSYDQEPSAEVKALVDKAIKEKKFSAEESRHYTALASANFEATKAVIEKMPAKPKLSAELNPSSEADEDATRANWTYQDYIDNDPEALEALWANDPKKARELEAVYERS